MKEEYEQMSLDTRRSLDVATQKVVGDTIITVKQMMVGCGEAPSSVQNRHEAYGIAAEQLAAINHVVKAIKNDVATLLGTLSDPNYPAVEATSSIVNSTTTAAFILIRAAAEMQRTLDNLYTAENTSSVPTPMDDWEAQNAEYEDADPADADYDDE